MHFYDLAPLPEIEKNSLKGENVAETMKELHEEIRLKIEESNAKYKSYADPKRQVKEFQRRRDGDGVPTQEKISSRLLFQAKQKEDWALQNH